MAAAPYMIYALIDPITKLVRYVGYTRKPLKTRLAYHYYDLTTKRAKTHKTNWLNLHLQNGYQVGIRTLEDNIATLEAAKEREVYWISQYDNLTNSTSGGESNKTYLPDVIEKMSRNRKGKCVGADNPMYGQKREDLLQRNLNNNPAKNPETAKKIGEALKIKYNTPEYKKVHQNTQPTRIAINQTDFDGNLIKNYYSLRDAALEGYGRKEIMNCIKGKAKQHKGYLWSIDKCGQNGQ